MPSPPPMPAGFEFEIRPGRVFSARSLTFEADFVRFAMDTQCPEKFPGLDTTKVPKPFNFRPVWKFTVDPTKRAHGLWLPCPVCTPKDQQFLEGALAYFPDEGVYRFIGTDCTEKYAGALKHRQAWKEYRAEQAHNANVEYLFSVISSVPSLCRRLEILTSAAVEIERIHSAVGVGGHLRDALYRPRQVTEWQLVAHEERYVEMFDERTGKTYSEAKVFPHLFGPLRGEPLLRNKLKLAQELRVFHNGLGEIDYGSDADAPVRLCDRADDPSFVSSAARLIRAAHRFADDVERIIGEILQFFTRDQFHRLDAWGRSEFNQSKLEAAAPLDGTFIIWLQRHTRKIAVRPDLKLLRQAISAEV